MRCYYKSGAIALCTALSMLTAGCSMADDIETGYGQTSSSVKTYMQLTFGMAGRQGTRANPTGGETGDGYEKGKEEENEINSAVAFLYRDDAGVNSDGNPEILAVVPFEVSADYFDGDGNGTDRTYTTDKQQVDLPLGDYNLIVVANYGDDWWSGNTDLRLDNVRDHIQKEAWKVNGGEYSDFLMTLADETSVSGGSGSKITLTAENDENNPAETTVDVERMAARVDYCAESEYECKGNEDEDVIGGKVTIEGAALVNNLTAGSYLLKRVSASVDGNREYLGKETPIAGGVQTNYVIDPWTSQKTSGNQNNSFVPGDYSSASELYGVYYPSYSEDPNDWAAYVNAPSEKDNMGRDEKKNTWYRVGYTLENTTPANDAGHAPERYYNTGVVFKAKFTPAEGTVNDDSLTYKEGNTFFEYGGYLFSTMEEVAGYFYNAAGIKFYDFKEKLNCNTWGEVREFAESLPSNDPSGYAQYLKTSVNGKDDGRELVDEEKSSFSWEGYMFSVCGYTLGTDAVTLDQRQDGKSTREALEPYGVRTYEVATCYYTWWILHSNDVADGEADNNVESVMEHGIVRNNIYKLKVESVYTLGDDVPGNTSLRVRATVNDWVLLEEETIPM